MGPPLPKYLPRSIRANSEVSSIKVRNSPADQSPSMLWLYTVPVLGRGFTIIFKTGRVFKKIPFCLWPPFGLEGYLRVRGNKYGERRPTDDGIEISIRGMVTAKVEQG
jgi:hypothetical protein